MSLRWNVQHVSLQDKQYKSELSWSKANECHINAYKDMLSKLSNIDLPSDVLLCKCVGCTDHYDAIIINYHNEIRNACIKSAVLCIP